MTIQNLKDLGILDLMSNGFNVYSVDAGGHEECITMSFSYDQEVICIGTDYEQFIPALYVKKGE